MPKRSLDGERKVDQLNRAIESMLAKPGEKPVKTDASLAPLLRVAGGVARSAARKFQGTSKN